MLQPTRRDLAVALAAAALTLTGAELLRSQDPVQRSAVFAWDALPVEATRTGERRALFRAPTATLDRMAVHATTVRPGTASHPPHRHPDEEMIIVKEGVVEQTIEGVRHRLGPGSVVFLAPGDEHGIRNAGETPATYYVLRWTTPRTAPN